MVALNPDFRSADDVFVPTNAMFGWTDGTVDLKDALDKEFRGADRLANDMPVVCRARAPIAAMPEIDKKWQAFQLSKGRHPGSCDWSLLDEFVLGKPLLWLPQIIGSCVVSNTFRGWVQRLMYQIVMLGMPFEFLGRNEFSNLNYAFYGPFTYGCARKRGNMRGGDGLYGDVMAESMIKDGVLSCNTPKLLNITKQLGVDGVNDYPEPQNARVYRAFGDWKYLDELREYADFKLDECPQIRSAEELHEALKGGKPVFNCSGLAIKKIGTHKDGFAIHGRDPGDSWAHNMEYLGYFIASDGAVFFRFSNESWGPEHIYNVPFDEVADWFRRRNVSAFAIGMINGPQSAPLAVA